MKIQAIVVIQSKGTKDLSRWIWIHHLHFNTRTINSFLFVLAYIFVFYFGMFGIFITFAKQLLLKIIVSSKHQQYFHFIFLICIAVKHFSCGFVNCVYVYYAVSAVFQPFKNNKEPLLYSLLHVRKLNMLEQKFFT